jgi:hypothetical protein
VALRGTFQGVHGGAFAGIEATGRSVSANLTLFYRIADGRIAQHWMQFDVASVIAQTHGAGRRVSLIRYSEIKPRRTARSYRTPCGSPHRAFRKSRPRGTSRLIADAEAGSNRLVGKAFGEQFEDVDLAPRQWLLELRHQLWVSGRASLGAL